MYTVILSGRAKKDLRKIDNRFKGKVTQSIELLRINPLMGEKMSGEFQGSFRVKIPPIRIIYTPDYKNKIILIRAIGHRQGIYK